MSLATRCPACQTVFRVVQDQLRVSEGWVRCGRCAEVFNALEHMVEVARPAPPPLGPAEESGQQPAGQRAPQPDLAPAAEPTAPDTPDLGDEPSPPPDAFIASAAHAVQAAPEDAGFAGDASDSVLDEPQPLPPPPHDPRHWPHHEALPPGVVAAHEEQASFIDAAADAYEVSGGAEVEPSAAAQAADRDADPLAAFGSPSGAAGDGTLASLLGVRPGGEARDGAATGSDSVPSTAADTEPADSRARREADIDGGASSQAAAGEEPLPSFLRQAQRAERWRRPGVRGAMVVVLLLGMAGLALQVGVTYRDLIAARWPASRVWLEPVCEGLGCSIEQPRWLDAVVVDSTGLTRIEGTPTYRLQVVLRNRSTMSLALPAIDLSLTDTQGRLVARRALSARELGSSATALAPQGELALQATLAIGSSGAGSERAERGAAPATAVAGYTIEVFYP